VFVLRSLPSNGFICYIASSLSLFVLNSLQAYRHFFFSKGCVCDVCDGLTFRPMARFAWCLLSNCSCCSLLKAAHHKRFPHRVPVGPGLSPSSSFGWCCQKFWEWSVLLHLWLLLCRLFFCFRGDRPLHNVQSLIFHNLTEVPTTRFTTLNSRVCSRTSYNVLTPPRRSYPSSSL
jgi:hypothetical protein